LPRKQFFCRANNFFAAQTIFLPRKHLKGFMYSKMTIQKQYWPGGQLRLKEHKFRGKFHRRNKPARQEWFENGHVDIQRWYHHGKLHRAQSTEPALITHYENGARRSQQWYTHGCAHRGDGPAHIVYYRNGGVKSERWYTNGKAHRDDGPALIEYYESGKVSLEQWITYDRTHRDGAPAIIIYSNGQYGAEMWFSHGLSHRDGAPAIIEYLRGQLTSERWYQRNKLHREDGPAYWTPTGEYWYLRGLALDNDKIDNLLRPRKFIAAINTLPQPIAEEILAEYRRF